MLKDKIQDDIKTAMRAHDRRRVEALRYLLSEMKNAEIDKREELTEEEELRLMMKELKKRKESVEAFEKGGRKDLVEKEEFEIDLISGYLPPPVTDEEIDAIILEAIEETGAKDMKDMGRAMSAAMAKLAGKADGKIVSVKVCERLQSMS